LRFPLHPDGKSYLLQFHIQCLMRYELLDTPDHLALEIKWQIVLRIANGTNVAPPPLPLKRLCRNWYFVTLNSFQGLITN
jgi:hypothetical protein